jgi:hypothetical protein
MTPPPDTDGTDHASALRAAETARIALATELDSTRRQLWRERALRHFPHIERAVDLIPHSQDEESYLAHAATLARHMS